MKLVRLASWLLVATLVSNFYLHSASVALAEPVKKAAAQVTEPVSINKASAEELQEVNGIGPALAERIISYREANSGFKSVDELKQVRGIGDLKFEKIKTQVTM